MKEFDFSSGWYWLLVSAVVCYLIGCFNFAVLISHIKKKDIRGIGSGNPGTMNMTRTFGFKIGVINFFCDAFKGGIPALTGYLIFKDYTFIGTDVLVSDFARYFFGIFVIIGHVFPVTLKFKGGKGIASTMGMFAFALPCEQWWFVFIIAVLFIGVLLYIVLTELGSMGSLLGVGLLSIWQAVIIAIRYQGNLLSLWVILIFALILCINLITWIAHSKNIFRLLAGEEHRTRVLKHKK